MPEDYVTFEDVLRAQGVEVEGTFDINRVFEARARIYSNRYGVTFKATPARLKSKEQIQEEIRSGHPDWVGIRGLKRIEQESKKRLNEGR